MNSPHVTVSSAKASDRTTLLNNDIGTTLQHWPSRQLNSPMRMTPVPNRNKILNNSVQINMSEIKDLKSSLEARVDSSVESILRDDIPLATVVREPRSSLAF